MLALCGLVLCNEAVFGQERCASHTIVQRVLEVKPEDAALRAHFKEHLNRQAGIMQQSRPLFKTTTTARIPVVFHVILTEQKLKKLGDTSRVIRRAVNQIEVLNEDFNGLNADASQTPAGFVPLRGNAGIEFGLARRKPDGTATNGVNIVVTTKESFSSSGMGSIPKFSVNGGVDAWDPSRYLNIWIVDIAENGILGYAIPPSFVNFGWVTAAETGVVIDYGAFGRREPDLFFFSPGTNDKGRTATHEVGHFFELEHIFGENDLCPGSGDVDDGIADTPPQGGATYNVNFPGNIPPFPLYDSCTKAGDGIMWMNFMDYVDDAHMNLFTKIQAARIQVQVAPGGNSYSLTQHPELFDWPTAVDDIETSSGFALYPNPATGRINISFAETKGLKSIKVLNLMGQQVYSTGISGTGSNQYSIDLTGMSKGIYMVQCNFETGTISKKLILQ